MIFNDFFDFNVLNKNIIKSCIIMQAWVIKICYNFICHECNRG